MQAALTARPHAPRGLASRRVARGRVLVRSGEEGGEAKVVREYREEGAPPAPPGDAQQQQPGVGQYAEDNYVVRACVRGVGGWGCARSDGSGVRSKTHSARAAAPDHTTTPTQPRDTMSKEMKARLRREYYSLGGSPNQVRDGEGGRGGCKTARAHTLATA